MSEKNSRKNNGRVMNAEEVKMGDRVVMVSDGSLFGVTQVSRQGRDVTLHHGANKRVILPGTCKVRVVRLTGAAAKAAARKAATETAETSELVATTETGKGRTK